MDVVLGIDVGGTGMRAALATTAGEPVARADREGGLRRGAGGIEGVVPVAVELARELTRDHAVKAVALGCSGAADLGAELREDFPRALREVCGPARTIVASDMVTAFFGALAGEPGVTLSVGTGAVAFGGDLAGRWRRADGRGDLLGDLGGGAWLGRAGMVAALRASDGRRGGSPLLLRRLLCAYADTGTLIRELNTRTDRAAVLAAFAPAVLEVARSGDPVAAEIRAEACRHLADTALAARVENAKHLAVVGGLPDHHPDFRAELISVLDPGFVVRPAAGTPVDGALRLATWAAADRLPSGLAHFGVQLSG
jgi:N-acetylglucosamine kinase-like BadF-type ATPase